MLNAGELAALTDLRRDLHRMPELSGAEHATAARVAAELAGTGARVETGLGGTGVAAVFDSGRPGPSVMIRCELDGLPITETGTPPWVSQHPGRGHMCGHDGHMTIVLGLARLLARQGPATGRVVLIFQPAEETGAGAQALLDDPRFMALACDWAFALHNMPGLAQGRAWLAAGTVACASAGLVMRLDGKTSHASAPEAGTSPAHAVARLIPALEALGGPPLPGDGTAPIGPGFRLATLCHARVGVRALGIAPGEGEVIVSLRAYDDAGRDAMLTRARALAQAEAQAAGLSLRLHEEEVFASSVNDAQAVAHLAAALDAVGIPHDPGTLPMRASEDFGLFGRVSKSAMVFLGAGEAHPMLHNPDYDFPDALIAPGVALFERVLRRLCG